MITPAETVPTPTPGLRRRPRWGRNETLTLLVVVTPSYAAPTACGPGCDEVVRPTSDGLSAGATAGIVVGVVAAAIIAVSLLVRWYYRRQPADNASVCTSRSASFEALPNDADFYDTLGSNDTRPSAATMVGRDVSKSTDALAKHMEAEPLPTPVPIHAEKAHSRASSRDSAAREAASKYLAADIEKDLPVIPARDPTPLEREILALCDTPTADLRADLLKLFDAPSPKRATHIEAQVRRMLEAPPAGVPRSPSPAPSFLEKNGSREELRNDTDETARLVEEIRSVFQASQRHSSVNIPPKPIQPVQAEEKTPKPKPRNRGPRI
ncbi:hypothetical protein A1Q2_08025 [Trichosporon asahii var. asahii CBS 8904]|uniref:Uncharacterized protein n=1 Tax=Trichosporon asahii var. asahii (strain CBS 8904) TaxID=1220162 RepID=K1V185_TRIAC|nr:hypothetical protein A1Q2_08025 [Trichosporon asahii var. asahii CBS 8904]